MNFLTFRLEATPNEHARLCALQVAFAEVCNTLAPLAREARCWNRVALHHLAYRSLRERFPRIGSQMVCNAIYSVSRTCRIVYQSPDSPFSLARNPGAPLALIRFGDQAPVYFDRHTLNLKARRLSMFTLDGRMKFSAALSAEAEDRFKHEKLLEIMLFARENCFHLSFRFAPTAERDDSDQDIVPDGLPSYINVVTSSPAAPLRICS
jgi:hypothetical protein